MHSPHTPPGTRRWDGTSVRTRSHRSRALHVTLNSPTRLLRRGQISRCSVCGNPVEWYDRTGHQPVSLHPGELNAAAVPAGCRWHVSSGIAHSAHDGTPWCRIPHSILCPGRPAPDGLPAGLTDLRRRLALCTRRLIDTGAFTPGDPKAAPALPSAACRPVRPVVQLLYTRYLAAHPVEEIRCVAQTRRRNRRPHPVLTPAAPGHWTLQPASPATGQQTLPHLLIAVYDLAPHPYSEQLRWRTQRCPAHAAAPGAADLARADWIVFDPLAHHQHIATRLPAAPSPSTATARVRTHAPMGTP